MQDKKIIMMTSIIGGSVVLIVLLAWLLDGFETKPQVEAIPTNNILSQKDQLPLICAETLTVLECLIGKDPLLSSSYAQLLSERNIMTNQESLAQECQSHYEYLQSLARSGHNQALSWCL